MRSVQPIAGQRHADQAFVPDLEGVVGEPQFLDRARTEVGYQRMRMRDDGSQLLLILFRREVEHNALLATIQAGEVSVMLADAMRADGSCKIALGRLDLDDLGPQVCEQQPAVRARQHVSHFHDPDAVERTAHDNALASEATTSANDISDVYTPATPSSRSSV